jgi:hypothetical protein
MSLRLTIAFRADRVTAFNAPDPQAGVGVAPRLPRIRSSDRRPRGDIFGDNSDAGSDAVLAVSRAPTLARRIRRLPRWFSLGFGDK